MVWEGVHENWVYFQCKRLDIVVKTVVNMDMEMFVDNLDVAYVRLQLLVLALSHVRMVELKDMKRAEMVDTCL